MNATEFRDARRVILDAMLLELSPSSVMVLTESEEWLDRLAALDAEYAASQKQSDPFFALLTGLDTDYARLKESQGNEAAQLSVIDVTLARLLKYAERLRNAHMESLLRSCDAGRESAL